MVAEENSLHIRTVYDYLDIGEVERAGIVICSYAETAREEGFYVIPSGEEGEAVKKLLDDFYRYCIDYRHLEEYANVCMATKYVPHGDLIQPIFDAVFEYFIPRVRQSAQQSEYDKQLLWKYIELSLEAYDHLILFRRFLREFRAQMPLGLMPKAKGIALRLRDKELIQELNDLVRPLRK